LAALESLVLGGQEEYVDRFPVPFYGCWLARLLDRTKQSPKIMCASLALIVRDMTTLLSIDQLIDG
jgi:hypothetical protein